jgi:tRNA C32,U32 (ribose-2'-O)-methylase TrmJ
MPARPQLQPIEIAHAAMLAGLARLVVPVIPADNEPAHFAAMAQHMMDVAEVVDDYMTAIGDHVAENATVKIDRSLFAAPLLATIEGNAVYEVDRAAEALCEELRDHYAPRRFA